MACPWPLNQNKNKLPVYIAVPLCLEWVYCLQNFENNKFVPNEYKYKYMVMGNEPMSHDELHIIGDR